MDEIFPSAESPEKQEDTPSELTAGELSQTQDVEPAVNANTDEGMVDVDKAWDMAHASKDERDKAAFVRQNIIPKLEEAHKVLPEEAQVLREPSEQRIAVQEKLAEHAKKYRYEATDESDAEQHELYLQRDEIERRVYDLLEDKSPYVRDALNTIFRQMLKKGEPEKFDEVVQAEQGTLSYYKDRREFEVSQYEADAEALEYWAGILHDSPPSEAYKERYGLGDVTPVILARLAGQVANYESKIKDIKKSGPGSDEYGSFQNSLEYGSTWSKLGKSPSNLESAIRAAAGNLVEYSDVAKEKIAEFAFVPGSEDYLEFDKIMHTEVPDEVKKAAYIDAFNRFLKNSELEFKLKKTFLEDIRTGRAAQWQ